MEAAEMKSVWNIPNYIFTHTHTHTHTQKVPNKLKTKYSQGKVHAYKATWFENTDWMGDFKYIK